MLDVIDFIAEKGGDPKAVRESQRRRNAPEQAVDEVIALYEDHRTTNYAASQINTKINEAQKKIGAKRKANEDASELLKQKADLGQEKKDTEESAAQKQVTLNKRLKTIGNYVHDSVPVSNTEGDNPVIRKWEPDSGVVKKEEWFLSHHEVLHRIDGFDQDRGTKIAGHRGYFLKKYGYFLNDALVRYGVEFLFAKGYDPIKPPEFMSRKWMAKTAQLEDFDDELYKVTDDGTEETDKYLIATSEQPLSALHADEWLQDQDLPKKYAGTSTCYRKEAGAHGKEAWGVFRVHQFEKVEQFLYTKPEKSWEAFDEMIGISEEFYKSLGIPYQVVAIVSGALNNAAAKKYDLEAWFPYQAQYKELVSCSNCTDYQSRELNIRYGPNPLPGSKKTFVHLLNCTLCATERALCCILENNQTVDGLRVPEVLRRFIPENLEFIPYTKELPKDTTSAKAKGNAPGPKPHIPPPDETAANAINKLKV